MESQIITRTANHKDLKNLEIFIKPFIKNGHILPRTLEELTSLLDSFFLAISEKEIVGCACLEIYSPKLAEIRSLAVAESQQGKGLGRELVQMCLQRAKNENIREIMSITSSESFFTACGFNYTLPDEKKALFFTLDI